jgi:uncharacterized membrane protein
MASQYHQWSDFSRKAVLGLYAVLLAIFVASTLWLPSCDRSPSVALALLHILPLLMFLPGVLKKNLRTHIWLCFILLGYFVAAVVNAFACPSWLPISESVVIVLLFTAGMVYVRWRSRALSEQQEVSHE